MEDSDAKKKRIYAHNYYVVRSFWVLVYTGNERGHILKFHTKWNWWMFFWEQSVKSSQFFLLF